MENKSKKTCQIFLDKYYTCLSKTYDFIDCKIYIDKNEECKLNYIKSISSNKSNLQKSF